MNNAKKLRGILGHVILVVSVNFGILLPFTTMACNLMGFRVLESSTNLSKCLT